MGLVTERTPEVFIVRIMGVRFHLTGQFCDVFIADVTAEALIHGTSRIRKIRFMAGSAIRSISRVFMIQIVGRGPGKIVRRHFFSCDIPESIQDQVVTVSSYSGLARISLHGGLGFPGCVRSNFGAGNSAEAHICGKGSPAAGIDRPRHATCRHACCI